MFIHFFVCFFILAFETKQIRKEQDGSPETDGAAVAGGGVGAGAGSGGREWDEEEEEWTGWRLLIFWLYQGSLKCAEKSIS